MLTTIDPSQLRAARALLNWSQADLARQADVSEPTINRIENGLTNPGAKTSEKLRRAISFAGVEFLDRDGVRHKPAGIEIFEGPLRFDDFYDFIYKHVKETKTDICIYGFNARKSSKYRKDPEIHRNRMRALKKERSDYSYRSMLEEGDYFRPNLDFSEHRWQKKEYFPPTSYYVFGSCVGLISFEGKNPPFVILIKSPLFAEAYRKSFNLAWRQAEKVPPNTKATS